MSGRLVAIVRWAGLALGLAALIGTFQNCTNKDIAKMTNSPATSQLASNRGVQNSDTGKTDAAMGGGDSYDGKVYETRADVPCSDGKIQDAQIQIDKDVRLLTRENCASLTEPKILPKDDVTVDGAYEDFLIYKQRPYFRKENFKNAKVLCELVRSKDTTQQQFGLALYRRDSNGILLGRMVFYVEEKAQPFDTDYIPVIQKLSILSKGDMTALSPNKDFGFRLFQRSWVDSNTLKGRLTYKMGKDLFVNKSGAVKGEVIDYYSAAATCTIKPPKSKQ
jgi:hypothetical protein